ncbi:uncharacterized protein LOC119667474 [Teleopsis dalmanni]|uniref:uncharacterized protein LOC119667404 n=1 Tax=Teleopsis dalmanni TaxID=139649 RepID=UPI0018CDF8F1|nr:uncharacterized protein LOC119667404 [Teleopsis dalmanni]XP_037932696.1 uncharacterized protein LOC119667474 [Teleopsis dalmanni]
MNKYILAFALILVVVATADARCKRQCQPNRPSPSVCIRERGTVNSCRRLRECRFREENCRLKSIGQPPLKKTSQSRCRNIQKDGSGLCAGRGKRSTKEERCNKLRCPAKKIVSCYRSKANNCRLMSNCQARRANCLRDSWNQIMITRRERCRGMKLGQKARQCRK